MSQSEIARIRQQIELEYEAAERALYGFAITAPHDFITARMERIHDLHVELTQHVGENEATRLLCESCLVKSEE